MTDSKGPLVVIPCLNEEAHIGGLLTQLLADKGASEALIVVADGGSTDGSRRIIEDMASQHGRIVLLDNPKRIQSAGVNLAARTFGAGRDWLVRVDAHAGYPDDYASRLVEAGNRTGATSVVVPMVTRGHGCFQRAVAAAQNSGIGTGGSAHRHAGHSDWIDHGHHAAMRLDAFMAAGGYDETFSHNEDAELDARLTRAGGRIWLAGDIAIDYYPRSAAVPLFRQYFNYGRGRARNLARHKMKIKPRQAIPLAVAPSVALAPFGLLFWPLAIPALVWAAACLAAGALVGLRQKSLCAMASGIAAGIMHLAWSAGFLKAKLAPGPVTPEPSPLTAL